ncbi:MAG: hypothetical protein LKF42_09030 [Streptococcaceae bacterium]|jgi:RNase P subunit RPR2|nr:hypothetical protein [Streptococcaceae bacterium]
MEKLTKDQIEATGIEVKNPIKRLLCKHNKKQQFSTSTNSMFHSLRGEQRVIICTDCGKQLGDYVAEYEVNGFKYIFGKIKRETGG